MEKISYKNFPIKEFVEEYESAKAKIDNLQRCTKCVLPETFPFIKFDEDGVCNFCHHYENKHFLGTEVLNEELKKYEEPDGSIKCVVSFSGGRDSSYALHYVKKVLGLDAVAFTYDWGVATDIAKRNQARMCEKLGVEQIVIKGNLDKKLANIRANLKAWLKMPDLGTIPLLTSVGQQFFYHVNQVAKRLDRDLIIVGGTPFEYTYFKAGFSGVKPHFEDPDTSIFKKLKVGFSYLENSIKNPAYINRSFFDAMGGYLSFYLIPHDYLRLYDYIVWNEETVNNTLINEYDWETSPETHSTWRIDDGTVPLSDYMYYMMSGLTISDTFRSNQIREGRITREKALELLEKDNAPRFNSIQWYCEKVGVDFETVVRTINNAPRLY
jgi:hypothetical protein